MQLSHVYFCMLITRCEADTAPDRLQGMFLSMCQVSFCIALSVFASRRAKSSGFSCSLNFHALLYLPIARTRALKSFPHTVALITHHSP